jgi:hypothetical protein
MIAERIGPKSVPGDFSAEDLTPEYEHYSGHTIEEDTDNAYEEGSPDDNNLELHPTPEAGDNSISAEVLLPLGSVLGWRKVISRKRNADGNTVGQAHDWPILDTWTYGVEFNNGTIVELTANKISECIPEYHRERMSLQALQHVWLEDLLPMEGRLHDMGVPQGSERVPTTRNG